MARCVTSSSSTHEHRRGRAADRARGAALGRRTAVDDRARGQRASARHRFWPRSATSAGSGRHASWSPISGLTRRFDGRSRPRRADLQARVGVRRAGRWSRRHGASSVKPGAAAPTNESAPAATARPSLLWRAEARDPVLVPTLPRRGLRPPAAVADREEAAAARDHRRRPGAEGRSALGVWATRERMQPRRARARPSRPRPPTKRHGPRLASSQATDRAKAAHQPGKVGASVTPGRA